MLIVIEPSQVVHVFGRTLSEIVCIWGICNLEMINSAKSPPVGKVLSKYAPEPGSVKGYVEGRNEQYKSLEVLLQKITELFWSISIQVLLSAPDPPMYEHHCKSPLLDNRPSIGSVLHVALAIKKGAFIVLVI